MTIIQWTRNSSVFYSWILVLRIWCRHHGTVSHYVSLCPHSPTCQSQLSSKIVRIQRHRTAAVKKKADNVITVLKHTRGRTRTYIKVNNKMSANGSMSQPHASAALKSTNANSRLKRGKETAGQGSNGISEQGQKMTVVWSIAVIWL